MALFELAGMKDGLSRLNGWKGFSLTAAILGAIWAYWLVKWGYEGSFLRLNALHLPLLDAAMPHFTHLGDGLVLPGLFFLIWGRKNPPLAVGALAGLAVLPVLMALTKGWIFRSWGRPPRVFGEETAFRYLSLAGEQHMSFPSGHTATAFCMLALASMAVSRPVQGAALALAAGAIGWSRLYIGVHFLGDVLAGAGLGYLLAWAVALSITRPLEARNFPGEPVRYKRWAAALTALGTLMLAGGCLSLYLSHYHA